MWTDQRAAPQDCGARKEDPSRRKLLQIALEEATVKCVEGVASDDATARKVWGVLEPLQLGVGTPGGTALLVSLLRQRAHIAAVGPQAPVPPELMMVLVSGDLKNAYGKAFRSARLRGARHKASELAAFFGLKWAIGQRQGVAANPQPRWPFVFAPVLG